MAIQGRSLMQRIGWGRYDKTVHFFASLLLTLLVSIMVRPAAAVVITIVLGMVKEVYDSYKPGDRFDFSDMLVNVLGAASGCGIYYLLGRVINL